MIAATELAPNAIDAGVRTLIGNGPTRSPTPGARIPMAVANAKASNVAISPIHSPAIPAAATASAISSRLQIRPVQPERQDRFDRRPHNIAASLA